MDSARLKLPFLVPGQGQKDVTHNEALLQLDLVVHAVVKSTMVASPPEDAAEGDCWLVSGQAGGAWAGHEGMLVGWTAGGWRFAAVGDGWALWVQDEQAVVRRVSGSWVRERALKEPLPPIAAPVGGTVVDVEGRAAIGQLIDRLIAQGILKSMP